MYLKIDSTNGVPLYLQIAKEVKHAIAVGSLRPGEQLPSVRDIAIRITVNPNTVAKAYRELEAQGIVETRRGMGTYVAEPVAMPSRAELRRSVGELIDTVIDEAKHLQINEDELTHLFHERIIAFKQEREKQGGSVRD